MIRARRALILAVLLAAASWVLAPATQAQPTDTAETPDATPTPTPESAEEEDADDDAAVQEDEDLPTTGAPIWVYGAIGVNVLQLGWGLLLVEDRLRRRGPQGRRRVRRSPFRR